jgi:hypothetical protein
LPLRVIERHSLDHMGRSLVTTMTDLSRHLRETMPLHVFDALAKIFRRERGERGGAVG